MFKTTVDFDKSYYIPAFSVATIECLRQEKKTYQNKSFRFYLDTEDAIFKYPAVLVSAGHQYKNMKLSEEMKVDLKNNIMLGDSGGYQIATGAIDIANREKFVIEIFKWLEKNTNYALNIDIPLYINVDKDSSVASWSKYDKIKISKEHFDYFQKNQSGSTKFLNVLHGRTYEDLCLWYDFCKDYSFTGGWALGSANIDIFYILQSFFFMYHNGEFEKIKNKQNLIHILGMSKVDLMICIEYLQKKLNEENSNISLTYDSSTPSIAAGMGSYFLSTTYEKIKYLNLNRELEVNLNSPLPCSCPVCKGLTYNDFYGEARRNKNEGFLTSTYHQITYHNLLANLNYLDHVKRVVQSNCYSFYEQIFPSKTVYIFKVIDYCFEHKNYQDFIVKEKYKLMNNQKMKYDATLSRKLLF
jgi:hypothetical protein